jgi:prepilin-type processing-associated H-X9-DG protein
MARNPSANVAGAYTLYTNNEPALVANSKLWQLDHTLNTATITLIDAQYGSPKIEEISDGTSVSIMFIEDVGQNEKMVQAVAGITPNSYVDPLTGTASRQYRWANPDFSSGQSKKINSAKNATYTTVDPNDGCMWAQHDCGPNSEMFSFHGNGAHCVFADGHVIFLRDTTPLPILRALSTRSEGKSETIPANLE